MLSNILQMCAACQTCGWTVSVGRALSENEFNATHVTSLCRKGILTDLLPPADQSLAQPTVNTALSTSSKRFPLCLILCLQSLQRWFSAGESVYNLTARCLAVQYQFKTVISEDFMCL